MSTWTNARRQLPQLPHRVEVEDIADVGLVDAHAKGVRRHHDGGAVKLKIVLVLPPLGLAQARVVAGGGDAPLPQMVTDLFHVGAGGAVDDAAAPGPVLHQLGQQRELLGGPPDLEIEVGPVEARHDLHRVDQLQPLDDVRLDLRRGRGRKGRHHRAVGQPGHEVGDL